VDHTICAFTALRLERGPVKLLFYEDFPYVLGQALESATGDDPMEAMRRLGRQPLERLVVPIDVEEKGDLIAHYPSQISTLFGDEARMRAALQARSHEDAPVEFYWRTKLPRARTRGSDATPDEDTR
jgi:hypothetical protein